MKNLLSSLTGLLFLVSCAHEETVPYNYNLTVTGADLEIADFLTLTKDDIKRIKEALKQTGKRAIPLTEDQEAHCEKSACEIRGKKATGTLTTQDLEKLSKALEKARTTTVEQRLIDGPVTTRCTSTLCSANLKMDPKSSYQVRGQGNMTVPVDYSPFFLSSFVGGAIGAAISSR